MEQSVEVKEVEVNGITYISTDYHISEYEKAMEYGHTQGKARGYVKGYNKGFEDGKIVGSRNSNKVTDLQEQERQLQEKAWDEGYAEGESDMLETLNELSRQQAEDWDSIETCDEQLEKELTLVEKYPHYYKDIRHLNILDIYRFFDLFEVTDPCIQHSMKKLAVGGKRGAKDYEKDIKEAMDTLSRWEYMQEENKRGLDD